MSPATVPEEHSDSLRNHTNVLPEVKCIYTSNVPYRVDQEYNQILIKKPRYRFQRGGLSRASRSNDSNNLAFAPTLKEMRS